MTQHEDRAQHYSPTSIRSEVFNHRVRGLDEAEVREYLDVLADQVEAGDAERAAQRAEIARLRSEVEQASSEISPQAVTLFSQAQQVADQLVEEAVVHARDLMMSARNQQRDILQRAHDAAEELVGRTSGHQGADRGATQAGAARPAYTTPVPEIEYVRTFARVAQVQLRSVLEALAEQVDRLDEVPQLEPDGGETESHMLPMPHSRAQQDPLGLGHERDPMDETDVAGIYEQVSSMRGRAVE